MRRPLSWTAVVVLSACAPVPDPDAKMDDASLGKSSADDAARDASIFGGPDTTSGGAGDADSGGGAVADAGSAETSVSPPGDGGSARDAGGTAMGCAGSTYKLCEDFESSNEGAIPDGWTALNGWNAGATVVASDQFHSGGHALKSSSNVPGQPRVQKSLAALGATAGKQWGRIFYKVAAPAPKPASGSVIHSTFVGLEGATESRVVDTVENSAGRHQFLYNLPDDSCCTSSPYDWAYDGAWHCAEWYVDGSTQSYRFFIDEKEVTSLAFSYGAGKGGAKIPAAYTSIGVGWIDYQQAPSAFVGWFDDLAIDDGQIGCH
jgi:hypothetical protein